MAKNDIKTNVMRLLEADGIPFTPHEFDASHGAVSGVEAASMMGVDVSIVFKTLVTRGASGEHYVFVIPAAAELDLKKAARASGEKSIVMIKQAELLPLTGYVHGGCSPIGMKKAFRTFFEEECILYDSIIVSAGKIGRQIEIAPGDLISYTNGSTADLVK